MTYTKAIEVVNRNILLSGDIECTTVSKVIEKIFEINNIDAKNKETYGDKYKIEPINLHLMTVGGDTFACFGLIDIIRNSKTPIHTYCTGEALSAGFIIYLYGKKRYIGKHSFLMYHEVATWSWNKLEGAKKLVELMEQLQSTMDDKITSSSSVTIEMLEDYKVRKAEWFITADEALKLKLTDGII